MPRLTWDTPGSKVFETGVDRGVLYPQDGDGIPWVGLSSITEGSSGGEAKASYVDGVKYLNRSTPSEATATLEAYTYPDIFSEIDGTQSIAAGLGIMNQPRKEFGLSYRTMVGDDLGGPSKAYKIHILYNSLATPSDKSFSTMGDSSEPSTFSWDLSTRAIKFEDPAFGVKYGSHLVLDTRTMYPWAVAAVEDVLYGTDDIPARLPSPRELLDLFIDNALLKITDNGDGTWTADGPDSIISMLDPTTFQINWPSAVYLTETTYQVSSL